MGSIWAEVTVGLAVTYSKLGNRERALELMANVNREGWKLEELDICEADAFEAQQLMCEIARRKIGGVCED